LDLPAFADGKPIATRAAFGQVLNAATARLPTLMGGSADLTPSNNTAIKGASDFQKGAWDGRYLRVGVREHAMGAILSGLALHKGVRPYGGTFLVFADYMRPAIRLAALMRLPVIYIFTHDSIAVGEDGPTHEPVEHLVSLRTIPGLTVIRPADATETAAAWRLALQGVSGPVALVLSRQNLPVCTDGSAAVSGAATLSAAANPQVVLVATGSEVHLCVAAAEQLASQGIGANVVSMPSWDRFERQSAHYRSSVFPKGVPVLSVEAGTTFGWGRYAHDSIGIDRFGASAPGALVLDKLGINIDNIVARATALAAKA
jgi:transketolase